MMFEEWLTAVGKELNLTPERVLAKARDEPKDVFKMGDTAEQYAVHFRHEAQLYGIQDDDDVEDFRRMGLDTTWRVKVASPGVLELKRYAREEPDRLRDVISSGGYNAGVVCMAIDEAAKHGDTFLKELLGALKHDNASVRQDAVRALATIGGQETAIAALVDDPHPAVRMTVEEMRVRAEEEGT